MMALCTFVRRNFRKSDGPAYGFFDDDGVWVGSECVRFCLEPVADVVLSSGVDDGELECDCIGSVTA